MARARITEQDPSLPHQIGLALDRKQHSITWVTCNCRPDPLGHIITGAGDPWRVYNVPNKHKGEDFTPNQKTWKVFDVQ